MPSGLIFRRLHQMKEYDCQIFTKMDDVLDARISADEVYDVIRQIKSGKAPGVDGIMVHITKCYHHNVIIWLVYGTNTGNKSNIRINIRYTILQLACSHHS